MDSPGRVFPPTQWSLIVAARDAGGEAAEMALDRLCRAYWTPLYAYARRWGADLEAAADHVQEFLSQFVGRGDLVRASPNLGKFRSFLLTAFQNHLNSAYRRAKAQKRGGDVTFIAIEDSEREERWQEKTGAAAGPEEAFDLRWAEETMRRALSRVEEDYRRAGNEELFVALRPAITGERKEDLASLGRQFGLSAGAAGSAVFRLRARFREALRHEVSQTVADPEEVPEEMRYLVTLLAR